MFSFIKNIGPTELIIIGVILTLFFGSKVVVWLAKTSGESLKEIKKVRKTFVEAVEDDKHASKNTE